MDTHHITNGNRSTPDGEATPAGDPLALNWSALDGPAFAVDRTGTLTHVNDDGTRLLEHLMAELGTIHPVEALALWAGENSREAWQHGYVYESFTSFYRDVPGRECVLRLNAIPLRGGVLLHAVDVTHKARERRVARERLERAEVESREWAAISDVVSSNARAFLEYYRDAEQLVKRIVDPKTPLGDLRRDLHTLKGNSGLFGIERLFTLCHSIEENLSVGDEPRLGQRDRNAIVSTWTVLADRLKFVVRAVESEALEVRPEDIEAYTGAVESGASREQLCARVESWLGERVQRRLEWLGSQVESVAHRLNKPVPRVVIDCDDELRLEAETWRSFWSAAVHLVSNAVDHGLESSVERMAAGKPQTGRIALVARAEDGGFVLSLSDDGRGICEASVRRAAQQKYPDIDLSDATLVELLCFDGVSTKVSVTQTSGRGVGMSAVLEAAAERGGTFEVESVPEEGTTFTFRFTPA